VTVTNYDAGRRFEYEICRDLRAKGYHAQRSAGSHSPVDVWAVPDTGIGLLTVQAKLGTVSRAELQKFWRFCQRAGGDSLLAVKRKEGRRSVLTYLRVLPDGTTVDATIRPHDLGCDDPAGQGAETG
jgi:Holliday junction resolvase